MSGENRARWHFRFFVVSRKTTCYRKTEVSLVDIAAKGGPQNVLKIVQIGLF